MYDCKQLKSVVFGISIVIVSLIFILPLNSHAAVRWEKKSFNSFGLSVGYESIEHKDGLIEAIYDAPVVYEGSSVALTGRAGRILSENIAVYLPVSFTFTDIDYLGIGMMLRPSRNSTFFFFGDVGYTFIGGPVGMSAGLGFDISHFTLDVSARIARGGTGQTDAALVTLSYLW